ncbi:hypothetical protein NQ317_007784, partial [Molorchus minor]
SFLVFNITPGYHFTDNFRLLGASHNKFAVANIVVDQKTRVHYILEQVTYFVKYVEMQRTMLYKKFGSTLLRPYLTHLYKPLDADEIKERKYWAVTRQKVLELVEDLIMITIYVVLLYLVILKDKHPLSFLSNIEVVELVNGIHTRTILLEDVERRDDVENGYIYSRNMSTLV